MNNYFENYGDWMYIGAVVVAFFVFLLWNKKRQSTSRRSNRASFKERVAEKKREREEKES